MSLKAIEQITEAENRAAAIIEQAQINARDIISQAQKDARAQYEADMENSAVQSAAILEKAAKDGEKSAKEKLQSFDNECERLKAQAASNMEEAVAAVMKRVIG